MQTGIKNIYIIDDDDIIMYLTTKFFERHTFCENVRLFQDPLKAMEVLQNIQPGDPDFPDAILLDLNMPAMNGWMFVEEMRKLNFVIPTFLFTSSIDPKDYLRFRSYDEILDYITKPIREENLERIVKLIIQFKEKQVQN